MRLLLIFSLFFTSCLRADNQLVPESEADLSPSVADTIKFKAQAIKNLQEHLYAQDKELRSLAVAEMNLVSELFYPRACFIIDALKDLPASHVGDDVLPVIINILKDRFWWYAVDTKEEFIAEHINCLLKELQLYYQFLQSGKVNVYSGCLVDNFVPGVMPLKNYLINFGYADVYKDFLLNYVCFLIRKMGSYLMMQTKDIHVFVLFNEYYAQATSVYQELIGLLGKQSGDSAMLHESMHSYQRFFPKLKDSVV